MNSKISEFCHFVDLDERYTALYNSLTLGTVIVEREMADLLRTFEEKVIPSEKMKYIVEKYGGKKLFDSLKKHKLLFSLGLQQDIKDYEEIQAGLSHRNIGILYLLTTDFCNLTCSYCFVENAIPKNYKFSMMTTDIAERGIDLFAKSLRLSHCIKEPQIIFYGGEPLANFSVLNHALLYIQKMKDSGELPANTSITINTNGTLIDEDIAIALREFENVNIAISIDGPKSINDLCRKFPSGEGAYTDAMKGYTILNKNKIDVGLCCTINDRNVNELQEISKWFASKFDIKSLGFNIMIAREDFDVENYAQKTAKQLIECFVFFRDKGIYEDRMMRKVNAFADGYVYYHDCGGCGQQIVISPDGMVGVCQGYCGSKKNFVPLDSDFDPLKHPIWEEWRYRSPLFMSKCKNCIALSICGGGCPYSADVRHGSIWALDEIFCMHAKATTEYLLRDLAKKIGLFDEEK